nr:quinolinate synthase NadA [Prescottella equi]
GRDRQDPEPGEDRADPGRGAGCSLADSITAEQLREWKAEHPDALVVSYVNTTAEVKGLTRHLLHFVQRRRRLASIDPTAMWFLPDQFLGAHVKRVTAARTCTSGRGSATCTRHQL